MFPKWLKSKACYQGFLKGFLPCVALCFFGMVVPYTYALYQISGLKHIFASHGTSDVSFAHEKGSFHFQAGDGWCGSRLDYIRCTSSLEKGIVQWSVKPSPDLAMLVMFDQGYNASRFDQFRISYTVLKDIGVSLSSVYTPYYDLTDLLYDPKVVSVLHLIGLHDIPAGGDSDMIFKVSALAGSEGRVVLDGLYWPKHGEPVSVSMMWLSGAQNVSLDRLIRARSFLRVIAQKVDQPKHPDALFWRIQAGLAPGLGSTGPDCDHFYRDQVLRTPYARLGFVQSSFMCSDKSQGSICALPDGRIRRP